MKTIARPALAVWVAACSLALLHHDFWWWDSRHLVLGFLPIGLAYHAGISLAAAALWAIACRWAWPEQIERWAEEPANQPGEDREVAP
jgi:hypothetical protein